MVVSILTFSQHKKKRIGQALAKILRCKHQVTEVFEVPFAAGSLGPLPLETYFTGSIACLYSFGLVADRFEKAHYSMVLLSCTVSRSVVILYIYILSYVDIDTFELAE